jgi:hypothetical protein
LKQQGGAPSQPNQIGLLARLHVNMARRVSMYRFEAFFIRLTDARHNRIKPMKLSFQVFVDEHQRLKRPAHVAIA